MIIINNSRASNAISIMKKVGLCIWGIIIVIIVLNRDSITVNSMASIMPQSTPLKILVLLCAFAVKSMTFVFYSGILFAVSGLLFPAPIAICVNMAGMMVMLTIPYTISRKYGSSVLKHFADNHPKMEMLETVYVRSDFVFSLLLRMIKIINYDLGSIYLGARQMSYIAYISGSMISIIPQMIATTVAGIGVFQRDLKLAVYFPIIEAASTIVSLLIIHKFRKNKMATVKGDSDIEE